MVQSASRSYLLMGLASLMLVGLPLTTAEKLRSTTVACLAPLWNSINIIAVAGLNGVKDISIPLTASEHQHALESENALLRSEVVRLTELLTSEQWLMGQMDGVNVPDIVDAEEVMERRRNERSHLLQLQLQSLPARVLVRTPTNWNSTLWLDVGQEDNDALGRVVVAKNSPVVVGNSLVGIVDLVNRRQCRVRLITDANCSPSVRAVRGDPQRQQLLEHLDALAGTLAHDESFFSSAYERGKFLESLLDIRDRLLGGQRTWMLAKGELRGSVVPLWRAKGSLLHGVGFNYDFDDEEGPARDLTTGKILGSAEHAVVLLQVNDILVTTGFDGVLPAGLRVAQVTAVHPLAEGDYFYELEARPTAGDMDVLSLVTVLPPTTL